MDKTNKITYGFKKLYYATVSEVQGESGVAVEYGTPVLMPGASSINLSALVDKILIPADDDPEYATLYDNKGYEGDVVIYNVPDSFLTDCLGMTIDGDTVVENKDGKPTPFALLFEFSGDVHVKRHVMYRCTASKPAVASQTKGDGTTANQVTMTITATPAKDTGNIKRTCGKAESEVYTKWYTTVPLSGGTAAAASTETEEGNN